MLGKIKAKESTLDDLVIRYYNIYRETAHQKTIIDLCIKLSRDASVFNVIEKMEFYSEKESEITRIAFSKLCQVLSDLFIIMGKCQDTRSINKLPEILIRNYSLSKLTWNRYPGICPLCKCRPCKCIYDSDIKQEESNIKRPITLNEWIESISEIYGPSIYVRSILILRGNLIDMTLELLSITSSIVEIERNERLSQKKIDEKITIFEDRIVDIFIWICAIAGKLERLQDSSGIKFSTFVEDSLNTTNDQVNRIQILKENTSISASEKGRDLEKFASHVFSMVPNFEVLPDLKTSAGQIDLLIRNDSTHPFLRCLGTHIIVECKSSRYRVVKEEITNIIDKMERHRCKCGILVTTSGVTGKSRKDALGTIKDAFLQKNKIIMIFSLNDLQSIQMGDDPIQILRNKYEKTKFM